MRLSRSIIPLLTFYTYNMGLRLSLLYRRSSYLATNRSVAEIIRIDETRMSHINGLKYTSRLYSALRTERVGHHREGQAN